MFPSPLTCVRTLQMKLSLEMTEWEEITELKALKRKVEEQDRKLNNFKGAQVKSLASTLQLVRKKLSGDNEKKVELANYDMKDLQYNLEDQADSWSEVHSETGDDQNPDIALQYM